tara:strand:+ start:286 stop:534 length:249 start_codon:yes stop_codon:yes gene_type:complete
MTTYEIWLSIDENDCGYHSINDSKKVLETIQKEGKVNSYIEIRKFHNEDLVATYGTCKYVLRFHHMPKYIQKKVKRLSNYLK